jgi:SAM-dependent methyltransferase
VSEAAAARGADAVGVDVAPAMVQHARARCPGLTFLEGDAEAQIVDAAIQAHALRVELPEGPSYYGFADHDAATRVLGEAGFDVDSLRMETVTVPWRVPTAELLFDAQVKAGVRVGAVLRAQPPERLRAIREAMAEGVARYADGDAFTLPIVGRAISAQPRD